MFSPECSVIQTRHTTRDWMIRLIDKVGGYWIFYLQITFFQQDKYSHNEWTEEDSNYNLS